jgi:hypothetical protein
MFSCRITCRHVNGGDILLQAVSASKYVNVWNALLFFSLQASASSFSAPSINIPPHNMPPAVQIYAHCKLSYE